VKKIILVLLVIGFISQANAQVFQRDLAFEKQNKGCSDYLLKNGDSKVIIQNYHDEKKMGKVCGAYRIFSTQRLKGYGNMEFIGNKCGNCGPLLSLYFQSDIAYKNTFLYSTDITDKFYEYLVIIIYDLNVIKSISFDTEDGTEKAKEKIILILNP
jgi:hypothetical protein